MLRIVAPYAGVFVGVLGSVASIARIVHYFAERRDKKKARNDYAGSRREMIRQDQIEERTQIPRGFFRRVLITYVLVIPLTLALTTVDVMLWGWFPLAAYIGFALYLPFAISYAFNGTWDPRSLVAPPTERGDE